MIESRVLGWVMGIFVACAIIGSLEYARYTHRTASGFAESETDLDRILEDVEAAYQRDGRLCPSTEIRPSDQYLEYDSALGIAKEPKLGEVGGPCLRIKPLRLTSSRNVYQYEASADRIVVTAHRAYAYDPNGVFPRFERRGEVKNGRLVFDRTLHRLPPGGKSLHKENRESTRTSRASRLKAHRRCVRAAT